MITLFARPRHLTGWMIGILLALLPGILYQAYTHGLAESRRFIVAISLACVSQMLFQYSQPKLGTFHTYGYAMVMACLCVLSFPPNFPHIWTFLAVFLGLFMLHLHGGFGQTWIHPAMFGVSLVWIILLSTNTMSFDPYGPLWPIGIHQNTSTEFYTFFWPKILWFLGFVFLGIRKQIRLWPSLCFGVVLWGLYTWFNSSHEFSLLHSSPFLVWVFFVFSDSFIHVPYRWLRLLMPVVLAGIIFLLHLLGHTLWYTFPFVLSCWIFFSSYLNITGDGF